MDRSNQDRPNQDRTNNPDRSNKQDMPPNGRPPQDGRSVNGGKSVNGGRSVHGGGGGGEMMPERSSRERLGSPTHERFDRGGHGSHERSSYDRLDNFDRASLQRQCKDKDCRNPVAWRNAEEVLSRGLNNDQEYKNVQLRLLEIFVAAGLPLTEMGDQVLPPPPGPGGMDAQLQQQKSVAWYGAKFDVERERRDWFWFSYNRNMSQKIVASQWCEEHTCRFFFSKERCTYKKPSFDMVCNNHAICPAFHCREAKGQYMDPDHNDRNTMKFLRHEFCSNHRCSIDDCELLSDELANGKFGLFCPQHRCHYKGCAKQGMERRGFCAMHKCGTQSCQKIAVASSDLCKKHVGCTQKGCTQNRHMLDPSRAVDEKDRRDSQIDVFNRKLYLNYCKDHGFCADNSCNGLRTKATTHCRKHACSERGCNNGCREKTRFCDTHRCEMDGCTSPKAWMDDNKTREDFCGAHLCADSDCSFGVPDGHLYCQDHECDMVGCIAEVADNDVCIEHAKLRYKKEVKAAAKKETEEWVQLLRSYPGGDAGGYYGGGRRSFSYGGGGGGGGRGVRRHSRNSRGSRYSRPGSLRSESDSEPSEEDEEDEEEQDGAGYRSAGPAHPPNRIGGGGRGGPPPDRNPNGIGGGAAGGPGGNPAFAARGGGPGPGAGGPPGPPPNHMNNMPMRPGPPNPPNGAGRQPDDGWTRVGP